MNDLYQDQIMDHYHSPRNKGILPAPEAAYADENPLCGDALRMELTFEPPLSQEASPDERRIKEIRFSGQGCAISQASASLLTELVDGHTVAEATALSKDDLLAELGITLSPTRLKCALLSFKVFKAALYGLGAPHDGATGP
jgi:nitrogen fixation protein NifU and related proteins